MLIKPLKIGNWLSGMMHQLTTLSKLLSNLKIRELNYSETKKNLGLGKSRIRAQKLLKGEYVAILDADDFFEKKNSRTSSNFK